MLTCSHSLCLPNQGNVHLLQTAFAHFFSFLGGFRAASTFLRQSSTALLQSVPAVLIFGSGGLNVSPSSIMQGGTPSVHFFKHTFAGALPQRRSKTWVLQQAKVEFCPRTLLHVW